MMIDFSHRPIVVFLIIRCTNSCVYVVNTYTNLNQKISKLVDLISYDFSPWLGLNFSSVYIPLCLCNWSPLDKVAASLADDISTCIFLNEYDEIPIEISLKLHPGCPIDNKPALVHVMAWRRTCASSLMHICGTRVRWFKSLYNGGKRCGKSLEFLSRIFVWINLANYIHHMYHVHAALLWSPELLTHQQPSSITFKLIDISSHNPVLFILLNTLGYGMLRF